MIEPKTTAERIIFSTVRITAETTAGTSRGTGFFYNFPVRDSEQVVPVIITNKHVIGDSNSQSFLINLHDPSKGEMKPSSNMHITLEESSLGRPWFSHPDPDVDLCCLPIAQIQNSVPSPLAPFYVALSGNTTDADMMKLDAIEDVIMVGYPNGLWDHVNNLPLVRKGATASHPGIDFKIEGQPGPGVTVVDMACFPGSSGSPVFVFNNGAFGIRDAGAKIGDRAIFIGILFSGPVMLNTGEIVVKNIPTKTVPLAEVKLMINLGYVIKPREILPMIKAMYASKGLNLPY
jgi:hypothetical protein